MTTDLKAAHYVLFNSYDYQKLTMVRNFIRNLFGSGAFLLFIIVGYLIMTSLRFYIGLLSVEGDEHKHQVRFLFYDEIHVLFAKPLSYTTNTSARF